MTNTSISNNLIYDGKFFHLINWKELLDHIVKEIDDSQWGLEVICPFGFEILQDTLYLSRPLKRFYCYLSSEQKIPSDRIEEIEIHFLKGVYAKLQQIDPKFAEDIIVMAARSGPHIKLRPHGYTCQQHDKLLVVEYRHSSDDVLTDYGNYLISCLGGFNSFTIPELERLETASMARTRLFQLYIILETLFGYLIADFTETEREIFQSTFGHNSSLQFYYSSLSPLAPSNEERKIIELIQSRIPILFEAVQQKTAENDELMDLFCKAYHGDNVLALQISKNIYTQVLGIIISTYRKFGLPEI